jgi:hypothetical protein
MAGSFVLLERGGWTKLRPRPSAARRRARTTSEGSPVPRSAPACRSAAVRGALPTRPLRRSRRTEPTPEQTLQRAEHPTHFARRRAALGRAIVDLRPRAPRRSPGRSSRFPRPNARARESAPQPPDFGPASLWLHPPELASCFAADSARTCLACRSAPNPRASWRPRHQDEHQRTVAPGRRSRSAPAEFSPPSRAPKPAIRPHAGQVQTVRSERRVPARAKGSRFGHGASSEACGGGIARNPALRKAP